MKYQPLEFIRKGDSPVLQERNVENKDGSRLPVLVFPALEKNGIARHCFTTRLGGVSEGIYATLNFSSGLSDKRENVLENFARIAAWFDTDTDHMMSGHQIHGTKVRRVGTEDTGLGKACEGADAMITDEPGIVLGIFVADCVPILFLDPVHRAIGAAHSGWRGTVGKIAAKTLEEMRKAYGTRPQDVLAGIGPSICQAHYEVSSEVADCFREAFAGREEHILSYAGNPGHEQLNLWEACRITLLEAGVLERNIQVTDICTCCNPSLLFSHRASKGKRGNFGAFIMLENSPGTLDDV